MTVFVRRGSALGARTFTRDTPLPLPKPLEPGCDYGVIVNGRDLAVERLDCAPDKRHVAGFHFAPGGNATARAGGDSEPAINPCSLWDVNFRPSCPDPRGMALVQTPTHKFWCDIYLLGVDHVRDGTSKLEVTIADGDDPPADPAGRHFSRFDYETAVAVFKHHGKGLLSLDEFFAAAFGVTEKTATGRDPKITRLDAPRTSRFGLMQATGNMWVWGHDGDPDLPRASLFGGAWRSGDDAGSRCADVVGWPENSVGDLGARGRCDHLQLG